MKLYSEYLVGICEYDFDLEHEYQSLLEMPFALQVKLPMVKVLFPWLTSETKRWNLGLTLRPAFLNKTRDTKDAISACPNFSCSTPPTPPPNTHPPTIKVYQTTKITKLGLCFCPLPSPLQYLKAGSQYQNWKAKIYSPLPETEPRWFEQWADLLIILPLQHVQHGYCKLLYS